MTTKFVVVGTWKRGALRRREVLSDENASKAFSAWRADESRQVRAEWEREEVVVWRGSNPLVVEAGAEVPGCTRMPSVSAGVARTLRGVSLELGNVEKNERARRRLGQAKRLG
jgi:hypothetical protein